MVRDGVANIVSRLQECGFDPRKIGQDAWESRCPGHRSLDHALSITRNECNHVVLNCRSAENCTHLKVIRAVGFTNDHLYAETPRVVDQPVAARCCRAGRTCGTHVGTSRNRRAGKRSGVAFLFPSPVDRGRY